MALKVVMPEKTKRGHTDADIELQLAKLKEARQTLIDRYNEDRYTDFSDLSFINENIKWFERVKNEPYDDELSLELERLDKAIHEKRIAQQCYCKEERREMELRSSFRLKDEWPAHLARIKANDCFICWDKRGRDGYDADAIRKGFAELGNESDWLP